MLVTLARSPTTRVTRRIDRFSIDSYTVYSLVAPSITVALLILLYAFKAFFPPRVYAMPLPALRR